jgi:hypothetical protein
MDGVLLTQPLAQNLLRDGFTADQIKALTAAMVSSKVDIYAQSYALGMERAYSEYGVEGVKTNIIYLMLNLKRWNGEEARWAKKVLRAIK